MTPEQAKPLQKEILDSAKKLERIVEMLEFFASSGAGRVMLRTEDVDLRELVNDVADRWAASTGAKHQIVKKTGRGAARVRADRQWLSRVFDELLDNAVKFSPSGGKITVSITHDTKAKRYIVSVADKGIGMDADETARAFVDFAQIDGSDTRSFGGLGLGLALVKRVTEAHGGAVAVESAPEKGSLFSVSLPAVPIRRK
jgi:signal transduction histidine kinase